MKAWALVVVPLLVGCPRDTPDGREGPVEQSQVLPTSSIRGSDVDSATGLVQDDGLALVKGHCTGCHSARLITQNRGDKAHWKKLIRWMQATQNLWPIPKESEDRILAYLERNYGPRAASRRPPIAPHLMPPPP